MADQVTVQIRFTIERGGVRFSDALYIPFGRFMGMLQEEVEALKEERFQAHLNALKARSDEDVLTGLVG
jgi:hypothetical protein